MVVYSLRFEILKNIGVLDDSLVYIMSELHFRIAKLNFTDWLVSDFLVTHITDLLTLFSV